MVDKNSRAPKQLGDFGEGLVTYTLIRKQMEVAIVDHVGADLIAQKDNYKIAVSVKSRMFRLGSVETRSMVIEYAHVEKLEHFAKRFDLDPVLAHVVCIPDDRIIHLFMMRIEDVKEHLKKVKHGFAFGFSHKQLESTIAQPFIDYSCWSSEVIDDKLFANRSLEPTTMRFKIIPDNWYAAEFLGDEFSKSTDYRSYSPIQIKSVTPIKSGNGQFELSFYHANYPEGVRNKTYKLQTVEHGDKYILARSLEHEPTRIISIYDIDWDWLQSHFPNSQSQPDEDVGNWLSSNWN